MFEVKPPVPTLREMLDQIDQWLCTARGGDLADVLAAVRGPDVTPQTYKHQADTFKDATTNVIRRTAFPQAFETAWMLGTGVYGCAGKRWFCQNPNAALLDPLPNSHFGGHIEAAAQALGLMTKREAL